MYNKIILVGNLTRDPEFKIVGNQGKEVSTFSLAVNRFKEGECDFFNIKVWGKQAENCCNYLNKGSKVLVEGSCNIDNYEKDGEKKQWISVNASSVKFLTPKGSKPQETAQESPDVDDATDDCPF